MQDCKKLGIIDTNYDMSSKAQNSREAILSTEIERKFLIPKLPEDLDLAKMNGKQIAQGYLASSKDLVVRLRRKDNQYYLTYKRSLGLHATECTELECSLDAKQFNKLWPGTSGKRLIKTRYEIQYMEHTIELDIFEGDNAGFMLAEVEFNSTKAADKFSPPDWFGADVTSDRKYSNAVIAESGFPKV